MATYPIAHLGIPAADPEAVSMFYCDVFGYPSPLMVPWEMILKALPHV